MQVLTADGGYAEVAGPRSRGWPLAGTQYQAEYSQGWAGLRLSALPSGESRILSYRRIYRSNPWVWTAVNTIARGLSGLPLRIYGWGPSGQRLPVRSEIPQTRPGPPTAGQRLEHLLWHPAPFISRRRLVRRSVVDKLVYGNALWIREPDGFGGTTAIYNVPWREVSVISGKTTPILGYKIMGSSSTITVAQDQVIQFGEGDPDGPIAPSPLESLQWTIALSDAMSRHLVAFFQNSARPSGVLKLSQMPDDRELGIIREQIKQLYSGAENAGTPLITSGEWTAMSGGTNYTDLVELAHLSREEVAAAYGIPQPVIGILDHAIKANVAELREQFTRDVLAPHGTELSDEIEAQLIEPNPATSGLMAGFDMAAQLMPDLEAFAIASKDLKSVYTINELRRMTGLIDLEFDWANVPWAVPGSLPMDLAPQGATINPDETVDPEEDQVLPGDDEADDDDLAA